MHIRTLTAADHANYSPLRRKALADEPLSFSSSPEDHDALTVETLAARLEPSDDSFVLGSFSSEDVLVGTVGVFREQGRKHAHKAFMWGVYVHPAYRRNGLGESLVRAAIERARQLPGIQLLATSVFLSAPTAQSLYLRCGFVSWGTEPKSALVGHQFLDEIHLMYELLATNENAA